MIKQIVSDFAGLAKVCGLFVAIKWFLFIIITIHQCIRSKNLQSADRKLGIGPFSVKYGNAKALMSGEQVISGIREIWVRDVYLGNGFLSLGHNGLVIDLGANMGNFTVLALASHGGSEVIAVEPNTESNLKFNNQVKLNNWEDRVTVQRYFIGLHSSMQDEMLKDPYSKDAKFISQKEFIELNNLKKIDFLKCDIEGSEFDFINDTSLLEITQQLAIEIHDFAGDRNIFINKLKELGFTIGQIKDDPGGCILLAKK